MATDHRTLAHDFGTQFARQAHSHHQAGRTDEARAAYAAAFALRSLATAPSHHRDARALAEDLDGDDWITHPAVWFTHAL